GCAACVPQQPVSVVDLSAAPQGTLDAMLHVPVLPLGLPPPHGVGPVGAITGYGCDVSGSAAATNAVQQLRAKALLLHATAVTDVLITQLGGSGCSAGYGVTASGIAVAARGVPPTW
ncbi:MAG TPA: hypothetical protein VHO91_02930, partial [Rhodopila sp.]|nr:hypothetical protein [Rhodopila sp.]